jgi:hypothetical protein
MRRCTTPAADVVLFVEKGSRNKKKRRDEGRTPLSAHKRHGKRLNPPFVHFGLNKNLVSWTNDRLPDMVWAALLIAELGRDVALHEFREFLRFVFNHPQKESLFNGTLTGFSELPVTLKEEVIGFLCCCESSRRALAPLLLFDSLPAREVWEVKLMGRQPDPDALFEAVRLTLFHQSQEATDCRWVRLMCAILGRRVIFPSEELLLLNGYPTKGDQMHVRPSIRAAEGAMDGGESKNAAWPRAFWNECWSKTPCMAVSSMAGQAKSENPQSNEMLASLIRVRQELAKHWESSHSTTAVDARHDAVFGIAFYAVRIAHEVFLTGGTAMVLARHALRTLFELRVTLAYLLKQDSDELWRKWRAYGAGQAKLASLKLDEIGEAAPEHLDADTLRQIANEDFWEEMVPVDVGHWATADLRKLSEEVGLKSDYDRYYAWTSAFVHGQWGPIRESVFHTCLNPLHRGHRCPYENDPEELPTVTTDIQHLLNKIFSDVDRAYPPFPNRISTNPIK